MIDAPVAIVTGAATGVGLAVTRHFLDEGWRVAMLDQDAVALEEESAQLKGVLPLKGNVALPEDVERMVGAVADRHARIDALINTAGIGADALFEDTGFSQWQRLMSANLDSAYLCAHACIPHLELSHGTIINVASVTGLRAEPRQVAEGTADAALIHLTRLQAVELGAKGIRVNCVCPSMSDTQAPCPVPLGKLANPLQIAQTIAFFCSPAAQSITGQCLAIDGGLSVGHLTRI